MHFLRRAGTRQVVLVPHHGYSNSTGSITDSTAQDEKAHQEVNKKLAKHTLGQKKAVSPV